MGVSCSSPRTASSSTPDRLAAHAAPVPPARLVLASVLDQASACAVCRTDVSSRYITKICRLERSRKSAFTRCSPACADGPPGPRRRRPGPRRAAPFRRTLSGMGRRSVVDYGLARRATLASVFAGRTPRRRRLRRAPLPAAGREVPRRGRPTTPLPDLPEDQAHPRHLRVRGRTRAVRGPGEAIAGIGRDGHRIWRVPGVRGRGLPDCCVEPPRFVLCPRHGRGTTPAHPAGPDRGLRWLAGPAGTQLRCHAGGCGWTSR